MAIVQEGPTPLMGCDQCGLHMHADRLFMKRQTDKCNRALERRIRWRYVYMLERCGAIYFFTKPLLVTINPHTGGN